MSVNYDHVISDCKDRGEKSQTWLCLGPETLVRWEQDEWVKRTKRIGLGRGGSNLGCTCLHPTAWPLLLRATSLSEAGPEGVHSLQPPGLESSSSLASVIHTHPPSSWMSLVQRPVQFLSVLKAMPHATTAAGNLLLTTRYTRTKMDKTVRRKKLSSCYLTSEYLR